MHWVASGVQEPWHVPLTHAWLVQGCAGLDVGDTVRVQLTHTDVQRGFIDFARTH